MRRVGLLLIVVALVATGCGLLMADTPAGPPEPSPVMGAHGAAVRPPLPKPRPRPVVDISGKWSGTWRSYDVMGVVRTEDATADFLQQGTQGTGRFVLHTTGVAAGVPVEVRNAGLTGVLVRFEVSGSKVLMRHELSSRLLTVDFEVEGDRMIGSVRGAEPEVRVVLTRLRRPVAAAPPASVATAPPPPPSSPLTAPPALPPAPGALEPPTTPQRIAAAPAPPPEPMPAEPARPAPKEFIEIAAVKPIYFDFDKYDIRPGDAKILAANVEWLKTNATVPVLIEGHCD